MKTGVSLCLAFTLLVALVGHAASPDRAATAAELDRLIEQNGIEGAVEFIERSVKDDPADPTGVDLAQLVIAGNYPVSNQDSTRLRDLVRRHSRASSFVLVPPDEPGDPLVVDVAVVDPDGKPVPGAVVSVYQTDTRGYYAVQDETAGGMNERNPRLFAYLQTDDEGRIRIVTIRPGGYPNARGDLEEGNPMRFIPQHIHLDIDAAGFSDPTVQLVFDDDPRMNESWRRWAERGGNPIVKLTEQDGVLHGTARVDLSPSPR
jgi:protocatechuate 3,4-dioxygenase, beta subunit